MIRAPFTQEQVAALNDYQYWNANPLRCKHGDRHPPNYTLGAKGMMVATTDGFICPFCAHKQDWADGSMVKKQGLFHDPKVPTEYKL